ncbi:1534_t:CDS:2, partial [Gigaspora margarita]
LIDEKSRETNDQLQINFVMAFEQAYVQVINEQLRAEHTEIEEESEQSPLPDQPNLPRPEQSPLPTPTNDLFDRLKKEIENMQKENAINLMDNKIMDQKIKNSKLQNNQIKQLQVIRKTRLAELQGELYEDNVNAINGLNNINNLNGLFDNIKNDKIMTPMQI